MHQRRDTTKLILTSERDQRETASQPHQTASVARTTAVRTFLSVAAGGRAERRSRGPGELGAPRQIDAGRVGNARVAGVARGAALKYREQARIAPRANRRSVSPRGRAGPSSGAALPTRLTRDRRESAPYNDDLDDIPSHLCRPSGVVWHHALNLTITFGSTNVSARCTFSLAPDTTDREQAR